MVSVITGVIGLLVAGLILILMRKDQLHVTHGLGWVLVAVAFAFLGFAPWVVDEVARFVGVNYPPVLALTAGIAVLVVKILLMDIERSRIELRNQRMVQRLALLEAEIRTLKTQSEVAGEDKATHGKRAS